MRIIACELLTYDWKEPMILCVTPNPAIDRTLAVPGFLPGEVHRIPSATVTAGGKGLNLARAILSLEGSALCTGMLGGHSGRLVAALAEREGMKCTWTWVDNETRTTVIVVDPTSGEATVINEAGPRVSQEDWERLRLEILAQAAGAELVCLCGSLPPGAPPDGYPALIAELKALGKQVWVDSSGVSLRASLAAGPHGVKVNGLEASELVEFDVKGIASAWKAASKLRRMGASSAVITLGPRGAVMMGPTGVWWAKAPEVQAINPVGSGDTFMAGLANALVAKNEPPAMLAQAVAAGAACSLSAGSGQMAIGDFKRLLAVTQVAPMDDN